jgi:hypothetical protein
MQWYFFGGALGIALLGPSYDFIFQGSAYIILDLWILAYIIMQVTLLVFPGIGGDKHPEVLLFFYGFSF